MASRSHLRSSSLLLCWFVALGIFGLIGYLWGPEGSRHAMFSKSEGLFINFESVYVILGITAVILSAVITHLTMAGLRSYFDLDAPQTAERHSEDAFVRRFLVLAGYSLLALAGCYFMFVSMHRTLLCAMEHDAFVYFDGAQRLIHGQRQHIDFHTPMGLLCNYIPYWGMQVADSIAGSMEWGSLIAGSFLLACGCYVFATRFSYGLAVPLLVYFCLFLVVPLGPEYHPDRISTSMFYNRFGWTALTFAFLYFVEPRSQNKTTMTLDAITLASFLLFMFYLKMSFALVGLVFLPLLFLGSSYNRKLSVATLIVFCVGCGVVELFHGSLSGYIHDLAMTIKASGANRGGMIPHLVANIREYVMAAIAVALACTTVTRRLYYLTYAGYVFAAGLAIIDQNTHIRGVVCLLAVLAVSHELLRRSRSIVPSESSGARHAIVLKSVICLALILVFLSRPIANRCSSMAIMRSVLGEVTNDLPGELQGIVFTEDLSPSLAEDSEPEESVGRTEVPEENRRGYLTTIVDGTKLLEQSRSADETVTVLDFVSPFSFILNIQPATGDHTCIHYGRTMNDSVVFPPEELLGGADIVMIPLLPRVPKTTRFLREVYGPYLEEHFEKAQESEYWELWKKKP